MYDYAIAAKARDETDQDDIAFMRKLRVQLIAFKKRKTGGKTKSSKISEIPEAGGSTTVSKGEQKEKKSKDSVKVRFHFQHSSTWRVIILNRNL